MNKNELVTYIAEEAEITKVQATKALEAFVGGVTQSLKKGEKTSLVGFGTFDLGHRKATTGRNPRTGEAIQIKAANTVKFKAGKQLKEVVNS